MMFVGRAGYLRQLDALLERVRSARDDRPGRALLIRGRRRVGKSRLVEEFLERSGVPHLFFAASGRPVPDELALFAEEAAASSLPGADLFDGVELTSWDAALRLVARAVGESDAVIVFDEIPYVIAVDPGFEGTLQRSFDRELSRKRLLLIGIGSDLSMMEALNEYGRPFHQRAGEMVVAPLGPAEVGSMLGLTAADAFDASVVTGGLPLICTEWVPGMTLSEYLAAAVNDPTSALLVSAERSLAAEFPTEVQARNVLTAIGSGERTFANIARAAGGLQPSSLSRSLKLLVDKRMVAVDQPLSTRPSKLTRYRVADSYLRFWLAFLGPHLPEIERGRGDRVLARIQASWTSWRGRAIEPIVRESVQRLELPELGSPTVVAGGYWTRTNDPEVDLVLGDSAPVANRVLGIGSIKWRDGAPFDRSDLGRLQAHRLQVPGAQPDSPLIAVSRFGVDVDGVISLGPDELLAAW